MLGGLEKELGGGGVVCHINGTGMLVEKFEINPYWRPFGFS